MVDKYMYPDKPLDGWGGITRATPLSKNQRNRLANLRFRGPRAAGGTGRRAIAWATAGPASPENFAQIPRAGCGAIRPRAAT